MVEFVGSKVMVVTLSAQGGTAPVRIVYNGGLGPCAPGIVMPFTFYLIEREDRPCAAP
jgi:hypothetical protein